MTDKPTHETVGEQAYQQYVAGESAIHLSDSTQPQVLRQNTLDFAKSLIADYDKNKDGVLSQSETTAIFTPEKGKPNSNLAARFFKALNWNAEGSKPQVLDQFEVASLFASIDASEKPLGVFGTDEVDRAMASIQKDYGKTQLQLKKQAVALNLREQPVSTPKTEPAPVPAPQPSPAPNPIQPSVPIDRALLLQLLQLTLQLITQIVAANGGSVTLPISPPQPTASAPMTVLPMQLPVVSPASARYPAVSYPVSLPL